MDDYERMRASYEIMRENERLRLVRSSPELAEATAEVARLGRALADVAMCDSSDCGRCIACLVRRAEKAERFVATADSEWKARAEKAERDLQVSEASIAFERVTLSEMKLEAHQLGTNLHLARIERDAANDRAEKAEANYAFMVERAADQRLDGYRELGARAAAAEERAEKAECEIERLRSDAKTLAAEHFAADYRAAIARADKALAERDRALQRRTRAERVGEAVLQALRDGLDPLDMRDEAWRALNEADDAE